MILGTETITIPPGHKGRKYFCSLRDMEIWHTTSDKHAGRKTFSSRVAKPQGRKKFSFPSACHEWWATRVAAQETKNLFLPSEMKFRKGGKGFMSRVLSQVWLAKFPYHKGNRSNPSRMPRRDYYSLVLLLWKHLWHRRKVFLSGCSKVFPSRCFGEKYSLQGAQKAI